mmetsp:Transcript_91266/g.237793  ORF Transcript_91266/g.237793 Transcript_91266/m.237793 type:complete len:543 (-) Transcript_91266:71-1699(-)
MKQVSRSPWSLVILARLAAAEWQLHESKNCFSGHGAGAAIPGGNPAPGKLGHDQCRALCNANPACSGVIVQRGHPYGTCYMRRQLSVPSCLNSNDFDLWVLLVREAPAPGRELGMGIGEEPRIQPPPLSIHTSISPRRVFANHEGGYNVYRIPALVHVGGSEVLAFIEGRSSGSDAGHIDIIMKRSTNDGEQWGPIQVVAGGPGDVARGNPSPVYCEKTGKLLLIWNWNNLDLYVQSSDDKGRTWSKPRKFSSMVKRPGWGWVATGPGHAIQLRRGEHKGRIVVPFNSFFADALVKKVHHRQGCAEIGECARYYNNHHQDVRVEIENPLDPEMGILKSKWYNGTTDLPLYVWAGDRSGVFYSDDGGDTWHLGGMVNSRIGSSECQVAETDEGLVISFRVEDKDTGCRKMAFSGDGGLSFEHFFEPQVCIPDPVCQGSVVALDDGRIVTAGPGQHDARKDITLHISHGSVVHNSIGFTKLGMVEAGDGGYSDVAVLPPKAGRARVGVIWEHGFAGGAGYAVVDMPPIEETEFKDPEDPWAILA